MPASSHLQTKPIPDKNPITRKITVNETASLLLIVRPVCQRIINPAGALRIKVEAIGKSGGGLHPLNFRFR
ncbi:MAG: hypothetical protein H0W77_12755 [Acidobacteria bacterium]|nr:hypothetical protein [Acidobacteriota bacterium]